MLPLLDCHQRSNHTQPPLPQACPTIQPTERHGVYIASPQFFCRQLSPPASIPPTSAVPQNFFHGGSKPKGRPESGARKRWAGRAAEGRAQPKTGRAGELTPKGDLGRRAAALRRAQAHHSAALCALRWRYLQPPPLQLPCSVIAQLLRPPLLHRRVEASVPAGFCVAVRRHSPEWQRSRRGSPHRKKNATGFVRRKNLFCVRNTYSAPLMWLLTENARHSGDVGS